MSSIEEDDCESQVGQPEALLGFIDVPIAGKDQPEIEDSFIGSHPRWLRPDSAPPDEMLQCNNCHNPMHLMVQTYASLPESLYDRIIYLFGCNRPECRRKAGSFKAIRGVCKDPQLMKEREIADLRAAYEEKQNQIQQNDHQEKLNDATQNLFGSKESSNPFEAGNPFENPFGSTKSATSVKQSSTEQTPTESPTFTPTEYLKQVVHGKLKAATRQTTKLPEFPGYLLYINDEEFDPKKRVLPPLPKDLKITESLDESDSEPYTKLSSRVQTKEQEEMMKAIDDPTFRHFTDIVSYNPGQVLRYQLNGTPLLYNAADEVAHVFYDEKGHLRRQNTIPNPGYHPNGSRAFELQLMPQAIINLESDSIDILKDGMEWGTILVATDSDDFIPDAYFDENYVAYVEEWCGVQWEEEVKR